MSTPIALLVTLFLLAGNAFFVAAEFAVITARRDRLETLAAGGARRAARALAAGRQLPLLIAGAQLGVTVCSLLLGALAEPAISELLQAPFGAVAIPAAVLHGVAFAVALVLVTMLHTVLGEMVPKNLSIAGPERAAMWLVPIHFAFCRVTSPLLNAFTAMSRLVLRLFRVTPKDELQSAYTPDELATMIAESREEGLLDAAEHRRLSQTLSSVQRTVADITVPLADLTTLAPTPSIGEVETAVAGTGFSRFPLRAAEDATLQLTGYLHVKDILDLAGASPETVVPRGRIRGLPELPADAHLDEALAALRRAQSHLAIAVSSAGTLLGVVTLEDLVEEYVGTVRDGTHVADAE
ncbi:MAG: hemolysin family protein [Sciscionella sp.]